MKSAIALRSGLSLTSEHQQAWHVDAVKQVSYRVAITDDVFEPGNDMLLRGRTGAANTRDRRLVVVDSLVAGLYGDSIAGYFDANDVDARIVPVAANEVVKRWDSVTTVVDAMESFKIDRRREPVIAVGGGVLTDVVGFAASIFRRGTPFIRVPTTLIGLVDAGVGVKTGINHERGKNRLGTYAPAELTLLDRRFLASLPKRHISNGFAEILKVALMKSVELFELLESDGREVLADHFQGSTSHLDEAARTIISESIHLMLEELQPNLWEANLERCVDYGHTFSPVLEMHALPELLHGEAVCIDMALTTVLGQLRGYVSSSQAQRVFRVMDALELPIWNDVVTIDGLIEHALSDTVRHRDGQQRLPLPVGIGGHRFANDVSSAELAEALTQLRTLADRAALPRDSEAGRDA